MIQLFSHKKIKPFFGANVQSVPSPVSLQVIRFAQAPYKDVFVKNNFDTAQKNMANTLRVLEENTITLDEATKRFWVFEDENYDYLTNVKGRQFFHTPYTDVYNNLKDWGIRGKLVKAMGAEVKRLSLTPTPLGVDNQPALNAFRALTDIYFYSLRREGALMKRDPKLASDWYRRFDEAQNAYLWEVTDLFQDKAISDSVKYEFQKQVKEGLEQLAYLRDYAKGEVAPYVVNFTEAYFSTVLDMKFSPPVRIKPLTTEQSEKLRKALLWSDSSRLRQLHETGEMLKIFPAWAKVIGPNNHQHETQDFTLLEHTLRTVEATKTSPYYMDLDRREQRLVAMAALLHDIAKHSAPATLRDLTKIDRIHPYKSMVVAKEQLPSLGFTEKDIEDIEVLVLHHQMIGNMMVQTLGKPLKASIPPAHIISYAAKAIGTQSRLNMLKALTEGDIASVKDKRGFFTPEIKEKLQKFSALIAVEVDRFEKARAGSS